MWAIQAQKVYENEKTIVLAPLPEDCLSRGHLLVIPREHHVNIFDTPKEVLHDVMNTVRYVAKSMKRSGYCDGINILNANEVCAQQSVSHLHFHLIPRRESEKTDLWPKSSYKEEHTASTYSEIALLLSQ